MRILLCIGAGMFGAAVPGFSADAKPAAAAPQAVQLAWPAPSLGPLKRLLSVPAATGSAPFRLAKPFGVTIDAQGRVFVADPGTRTLVVWGKDRSAAAQWKGDTSYPLMGPVAVAADLEGRVFAVDGFQARVVVFDGAGKPVADFGKGILKRPEGIAIDPAAGRVYVGDVKLHRVFAFSLRTLKLEREIGGTGGLQFDVPAQVAVNSKGQLLVSDGWNCSVHILDASGKLVRRFPTQCGKRGEFGRPRAIAVDTRDRIYVASPDDDSLQIFEPDGKPLQLVRTPNGHKARPGAVRTGLAIDREDRVYVIDQHAGEGCLQVFAHATTAGRPRRSSPGPAQ